MSISVLKRKSQARNVSGKPNGGFSLNNPRRVDAHANEPSSQTKMRGLGYKGHGGHLGAFPVRPVMSQYINLDPMSGPRESVLSNHAQIETRFMMKTTYPMNVVQATISKTSEEYLFAKRVQATEKEYGCDPSVLPNSGRCDCITGAGTHTKPVRPMPYSMMYTSRIYNKKGIPPKFDKQHYPPPFNVKKACEQPMTLADFLAEEQQKKTDCS
jgi:hypothetical protein